MRKNLDLDILEGVVSLTCESMPDGFTAYDVTQKIREKLDAYNIPHEDVRDFVRDYVIDNSMEITTNGKYNMYSRNKFSTNPVPAVVLSPPVKVSNVKQDSPKKVINLFLQSESRVNLTNIVRSELASAVYVDVVKTPQGITVKTVTGGMAANAFHISEEIRLRTGFSTAKQVKISVFNDRLEIAPA